VGERESESVCVCPYAREREVEWESKVERLREWEWVRECVRGRKRVSEREWVRESEWEREWENMPSVCLRSAQRFSIRSESHSFGIWSTLEARWRGRNDGLVLLYNSFSSEKCHYFFVKNWKLKILFLYFCEHLQWSIICCFVSTKK